MSISKRYVLMLQLKQLLRQSMLIVVIGRKMLYISVMFFDPRVAVFFVLLGNCVNS